MKKFLYWKELADETRRKMDMLIAKSNKNESLKESMTELEFLRKYHESH